MEEGRASDGGEGKQGTGDAAGEGAEGTCRAVPGTRGEGAARTEAQRQGVAERGGPGRLAAQGVGAGEDLLSSPSPNPKSGSSLCTLGLGLRFLSKLGSPCGCR